MKILRLPFCVFLFMFVYAMEDWLRSSFLSGVVGTSHPPLQLCNFFFICCLWRLLIHGDIHIRFLAVFLALQDLEIIAMVIVISGLVF